MILRVKERISEAISEAVLSGFGLPRDVLPKVLLERPKERSHGDFATNVAMILSKHLKASPREIAEEVVRRLELDKGLVKKVEVAGPGFINFFIADEVILGNLLEVRKAGMDYGRNDMGKGKKVQVEFVSANPTGRITAGNARGAALGDCIANILSFSGFDVHREYYINDVGTKILLLWKSVNARFREILGLPSDFPEGGYRGEYVWDLARYIMEKVGRDYIEMEEGEQWKVFLDLVIPLILSWIEEDLRNFGVVYDTWFSERTLHESGEVSKVIEILRENGYVYEADGAVWFASTKFGDDKDRVLVRKDGSPTYLASDIAYHKNKLDRGFERIINIWGADHQGHVLCTKAAIQALLYDPDALEILIYQLVTFVSGKKGKRMSKKSGEFITLSELIEELGKDVARYFFVMRTADAHLEFDLELAKSQSMENPVYYIQYAHERAVNILKFAKEERGIDIDGIEDVDLSLLREPEEMEISRMIFEFPDVVEGAARTLEPHRIARYLEEISGVFHSYYNRCRVVTEEIELSKARLVLTDSLRTVLSTGLSLLGVSAPERM
jgi:arginyl-tRNA synthetase